MKKKQRIINNLIFLTVFLIGVSCQEEEVVSVVPPEDNISRGSELAKTMQRVVTHDGSYDDVVDGGNCYSINFPYSLLLNGSEVVVDDISHYDAINESDEIQIIYPITITTHEHKESFITGNIQLEQFAANCSVNDDDIECIDFLYPIKLSLFNTDTNSISTLEIDHDSQFYKFMESMDEKTLISINYPIQLKLYNSLNVDATHNAELLEEILEVITACDENDG